jgi:hypothetical protein
MAQADSHNTKTPSRRAVLSGAAGAALATTTAPAVAAAGILAEPDPIFAAIEAHRAAEAAFTATVDDEAETEEHDPRRPAVVIAYDRASDNADAAAWALIENPPTTIAGAAALLRYADKLFSAPDGWESELHESLAAVLAKIAASGVS